MSNRLYLQDMEEVSLSRLKELALDAKESLWQQAERYGRDVKIYLHWTAGGYSQFFDGYHIQVDYDGKIYVPIDIPMYFLTDGTWKRNSGAVNMTILACANATTNDPGTAPPTAEQLETFYMAIAVVAKALDLTIDIEHVMTHGEAADNEDGIYPYPQYDEYGPLSGQLERWDLEVLWTDESPVYNPKDTEHRGGTILRGKANFYNDYYNGEVENYWNNSVEKIKDFNK